MQWYNNCCHSCLRKKVIKKTYGSLFNADPVYRSPLRSNCSLVPLHSVHRLTMFVCSLIGSFSCALVLLLTFHMITGVSPSCLDIFFCLVFHIGDKSFCCNGNLFSNSHNQFIDGSLWIPCGEKSKQGAT